MGSRASMRDDDIARAEFVVDSARQAVGDIMRKIEQVCPNPTTPSQHLPFPRVLLARTRTWLQKAW